MSLKHSYTLIAPFYDAVISRATQRVRADNLKQLPAEGTLDILIDGIGTGLDLPHLPPGHHYTGVDLTPAMLRQAEKRRGALALNLLQCDCHVLPFPDQHFDHVVAHLILAVVPQPLIALQEAARVLKSGGTLLVLDKFLRPGQKAPLRRLLTPLSKHIATRMDVVFEDLLAKTPSLRLESDRPVLAGGWFRALRLVKY
ncbi:MAG: class I SAM-dependent methyltransferase [Burkholderiales bacterium]